MPRPQRKKVAPSAPAPRGRKATTPTLDTAINAPKAKFDDMYDVSDSDNEKIMSVRHAKKNSGKGKEAGVSRGRVRSEDAPAPIQRGDRGAEVEVILGSEASTSPVQSKSMDDIEHGSNSPEMEVGRRGRNTPAVESSSLAIGNFRRRARQPSILGRGAGRARSSSVESDMAEDDGLTTVGRTNTSVLATGNFKRRPRQGSILGRNTTAMAPSSMGLEMGTPAHVGSALKLGNFKRRARAPSILGTAQKARQPRPEYEDEDEDDFNPEDESTPLNLSKTRNMTSSSSASNSRKRKLSADKASRSSPISRSPEPEAEEERIPATRSDIDDEAEEEEDNQAPSSPQQPLVPDVDSRSVTPEPMSETMAPPQGSSSVASSPEPHLPTLTSVSRGRRPLRGRTPPPATLDSSISSPPSLTHSPNRPYMTAKPKPKPKGKKEAPPASNFSTAQLQALLPRRRRATLRDPFEIPSSEDEAEETNLASDEDELSQMNVRARNRRSVFARTPAPSKRVTKPKPPPKSTAKRTYGSRANATSDKENEEVDPDDSLAPLPDDDGNGSPENSQELEERVGKELKKAARKFEEVDKWELEFEDVTGSSSPKDAR